MSVTSHGALISRPRGTQGDRPQVVTATKKKAKRAGQRRREADRTSPRPAGSRS